jgi:UPF0755 protein
MDSFNTKPKTGDLSPKPRGVLKASVIMSLVVVLGALIFLYHLFIGPANFNVPVNEKLGGVLVEVKPGMGAKQVAYLLKDSGVISSVSLFSAAVSIFGDSKKIVAGYYLFKDPVGVLEAEDRIRSGEFGLEQIKLTFPEGFTVRQVGERVAAASPLFNIDVFMELASTSEGYLFPDTYFFLPTDSEAAVINRMKKTFKDKTEKFFASSTESESDIVKMASVIEKEVQDPKDMKIVSGILWKRIEIGMALQVDATLAYERGLASHELSIDDLEEDSPYNSYTNRGLPPTPIDNPGLNAIIAALNPEKSPYLYFLTDSEGKVYYARTFEEHKENKAKYLR